MRRENLLVIGSILLLGLLHLATLRPGHEWGDDFSLYLAHARNLAEGRPYADTGYVYNPHYPKLSPRTYPPIFPILLAPVWAIFGLNLPVLKVYLVLLFMGLLWVLAVTFRRRLPFPAALACLWLFGANPVVWEHKDRLLSETPFMLFVFSALLAMERALSGHGRTWAWGLLAGLLTYLAFGTRTAGVVLLPALVVCEWSRTRRIRTASVAAAVAFIVGVSVQKMLHLGEGTASYLDQMSLDPLTWLGTVAELGRSLGHFVENGWSAALTLALAAPLAVLAAIGFGWRRREDWTANELFALFSLGLLVFWPFPERRYLLPILPLFFLYSAEGLEKLKATRWTSCVRPAAVLLLVAVLGSYAVRYDRSEAGPFREGVTMPESVALFDYVRTQTGPSDVFLFQKPRALALYTGKRASGHAPSATDEQLWAYVREARITHVILCRHMPESAQVLEPWLDRHPERWQPVYRNDQFDVFRLCEDGLAAR
jgi:4-amino-4-deoxy-L-arabinose transferase-like glycosyltransferase